MSKELLIDRRTVLAGAAALAAQAVHLPARAQSGKLAGVTLRVGTYGGSWRAAIHELIGSELEKEGAKIEYVIGNPRDNLAKLVAARNQTPPFDVIELTDPIKTEAMGGGFLAPLNMANIPNAKGLSAAHKEQTAIATWVSVEGLVYNKDKFAELGLPPPQKFADLFNEKLAGHVSFPDINYGGVVNALIGFANEFGGGDETNLEAGFQAVNRLKPATFYKSSVELSTQFKSGDIWAAVWHAGWAVRMRNAGLPLGTTYPAIKDKTGMIQLGWIGVVKGANQQAAGEQFINRYLDKGVQEALARRNGVAPINKEATPALLSDPLLNELMLLKPEAIGNAYYADWSKVSMSALTDKWNRSIAQR